MVAECCSLQMSSQWGGLVMDNASIYYVALYGRSFQALDLENSNHLPSLPS